MVMPCETFFIHQGPQDADGSGAKTEKAAGHAQGTRLTVRREAAEVNYFQICPTHAECFTIGEHPDEPVKQGDDDDQTAEDGKRLFGDGDAASKETQYSKEETARRKNQPGINGCCTGPVHGAGGLDLTADSGFYGGFQEPGGV